MSCFSLAFVAEAVHGTLVGEEVSVTGVVVDSRLVRPGNLFVAISGQSVDGHTFIPQAVARGAVAVIVSQPGNYPCPVVMVEDGILALAALAAAYLRTTNTRVIGITGSLGKTSTKEMTAAAVSAEMSVYRSPGNMNTEIGLPLSVLSHNGEAVMVLEMGMRGLGQIAELASIAPPDIAVITNVGESHLELLGSRDNIARAKGEILLGMKNGGIAILNRDDDYFEYLANLTLGPIISVGKSHLADFCIERISLVDDGCYQFRLRNGSEAFWVRCPWPGEHNVYNATLAVAAAAALGVDVEHAIAALQTCEPGDKRLHIIGLPNNIRLIDDTYNASPASMRSALHTLTEISPGRRIAVLGGMLELGLRTESGHREVGTAAAGLCDLVITVGDLAEIIAEEAERAGTKVCRLASTREAVALLQDIIQAGDTVLIKGSRGLQMEYIVKALREGVVGRVQ